MHAFPLFSYAREPELVRARPRDDDEVDAFRHEVRPEPEALATHALHAASDDRVADLLGHDQAEPRGRAPVSLGRDQQDEMRRRRALPLRLDAHEVRATANTPVTPV